MHDFAWEWLGFMAVLAVGAVGSCTLGPRERREANRRSLAKALNDSGWLLLSVTLKNVGHAFPRDEHHVPWLWIPPLILGLLTWSVKGALWSIRWYKRRRPAETAYTRSLRKSSGRMH